MKAAIISGVIGLLAGALGGYFVAKRRFDKELEKEIKAIKETNEALQKKREEKKAEEESKTIETEEEPEDLTQHPDVDALAAEEGYDENYSYVDEPDEDGYYINPHNGEPETEAEREARLYEEECRKEIEQYISEGHDAYNITEEMYNEPFEGYKKGIVMINEELDEAYDSDTGERIEDWHVALGTDWGTLDTEREDHNGRIFIRCERLATDYEVDYCIGNWV